LLRTLFMTTIFVSFLAAGLAAPFILTLGYVWVDTLRPQDVTWYVLNQMPVALIMGVSAVAGYFLLDWRSPPRLTLGTLLTVLIGCWITATMFWAEVPAAGWPKWDWAFKSVMFSAFIPLVIRSRVQIEAFVQIYVLSLAANFIPFAAKVLISGGGYGINLGLMGGNANLSEGELLSTVVLMAIPLALHLGRHTQFLPHTRLVKLGYTGLAACAFITALGTYERSALIAMVALGAYMLIRSRNKLLFGLCLVVVAAAVAYMMSNAWFDRIATIQDPTSDSSAMVRLLAWSWTIKYVFAHPFGGGFNCFVINHFELPNGVEMFSRAFQSSYFEMLGEHGWIGLGLLLALLAWMFLCLRRLARRARAIQHLDWCADMADALQAGMVAFLVAAAFVDILFQPELWYFIAMSVSLREYVRRVDRQAAPAVGWRARALPAVTGTTASVDAAGAPWRHRPAWGKPGTNALRQ
jgi:putative inorganic carbon (hco3(-)) transporter